MIMPSIKIDGKSVTVTKGSTILNACQKLGIKIPTLCYLAEYEHHTSCMVCVVKDKQDDRLLPSCAALVRDGMEIETRGAELDLFRKSTLELLLSEHLGDCEAPCRRACPAYMDIPGMIEKIKQNDLASALAIIKEHIPFPAISARICSALCQKACRRKHHDEPVNIRLLVRFMADREAELNIRSQKIKTAKKGVAIVGAGVTGLAAAYYLLQTGYRCTVFDKNPQPWGSLPAETADDKLPKEVLKQEIDKLVGMGLVLKQNTELGRDISIKQLKKEYKALVLALGQLPQIPAYLSSLQVKDNKLLVKPSAFQTSQPAIFAGGALIGHCPSAVKAMAQGKAMATAAEQYLSGNAVQGYVKRVRRVFKKKCRT
jgi:NADPH-dependent glutamate synthase beta subunit-like oxidoreductase